MDFTGARDSEWQWHQLGHMQVCTLLQTDNHASTPPLCFLQAGCPSCRPTNSVKALKAHNHNSNAAESEVVRTVSAVKRRAVDTNEGTAQVINHTVQNLAQAVQEQLPPGHAMKKVAR